MSSTATAAPSATSRPLAAEYAAYYHKYIAMVPDGNVVQFLKRQGEELVRFLNRVSDSDASIVHAPYSWTIKQVVNHIIDGERIFAYRLLRIARGDTTPLPGFDENEYARTAKVDSLTLADLVNEFESVRTATLSLIANLPAEAWQRNGTANDKSVSARALAWIMAGHVEHHSQIMKTRLGKTD